MLKAVLLFAVVMTFKGIRKKALNQFDNVFPVFLRLPCTCQYMSQRIIMLQNEIDFLLQRSKPRIGERAKRYYQINVGLESAEFETD